MLAGGGTGGHVFPSLAVAAALRRAAPDLRIEFVGTATGLEATLVPAAGWTLHTIEAAPLARKLSVSTLRLPLVLLRAVKQAGSLLSERSVVGAVVFGGYVSVPLALAARKAGIPLVVHEQNAVPGLANRLAGRWAAAVALTHEGSGFGRARPVVTGNPVRPGLDAAAAATSRQEAIAHFGLEPTRRTLLVFGGSQGARRINRAAIESVRAWSQPHKIQILHAAGRRDFAEINAAWDAALASAGEQAPLVRCVDFIERMELAYAAADAVVCRAGASTLAELTVLGLPSVLVPYPHATADHQTANAASLAAAGGAAVVADDQLDSVRLVAEAQPLLLDDDRRQAMATAAAGCGRPDAADHVAALLLEALGRNQDGGA
jgi:UDP-N-acetylglucosamine--N-acetylmuramyl-(pentapeptide) pyrophosphoryl-undecaprenol N-acetylglucosamine transferase